VKPTWSKVCTDLHIEYPTWFMYHV